MANAGKLHHKPWAVLWNATKYFSFILEQTQLTLLVVPYLYQVHHRVRTSVLLKQYQQCVADRHGSEGQGLRHGQNWWWHSQFYLKHVCRAHSYAFTTLHPCLYLASFSSHHQTPHGLPLLRKLGQDLHGDTLNTRPWSWTVCSVAT